MLTNTHPTTAECRPEPASTGDSTGFQRRLPQPAPALRVFVVDDHAMFRRGLGALLAEGGPFTFVGEAASGDEALQLAPRLAPDLVLLDMVMPDHDGIDTLLALRPLLPRARFVAMSCRLDLHEVRRALAAGASCFVLKTASGSELLTVMQAAHRGLRLHSPAVMAALAAGARKPEVGADLTGRERTLLGLMAQGLPNRAIAGALGITLPTVKFHVTHVLAKLNAANRTAAVLTAMRHGLVTAAAGS